MPIKRKTKLQTMTENLGKPNQKVTEQFGPEEEFESESERIKRKAGELGLTNLARTTTRFARGMKIVEEVPPESFAEGLESSLIPEEKSKRMAERIAVQEQLRAQQDLTAGETIGLATQPTTLKGVVESGMRTLDLARQRGKIFAPIKMFLQESKALIRQFGKRLPFVGGLVKETLSTSEITSRYDKTLSDIQNALASGGDPLDAEFALQQIEQDLAQVASTIQIESKYDFGAIVDGRMTDEQVRLAELQRQINMLRLRLGVVR